MHMQQSFNALISECRHFHFHYLVCPQSVISGAHAGPLPEGISRLTELRELLLDVNKLTGTIPESWATMDNLQRLFLSENILEGALPPAFSRLSKLRVSSKLSQLTQDS
jgi:hypothetical protein